MESSKQAFGGLPDKLSTPPRCFQPGSKIFFVQNQNKGPPSARKTRPPKKTTTNLTLRGSPWLGAAMSSLP
jgi:hypothetical protein